MAFFEDNAWRFADLPHAIDVMTVNTETTPTFPVEAIMHIGGSAIAFFGGHPDARRELPVAPIVPGDAAGISDAAVVPDSPAVNLKAVAKELNKSIGDETDRLLLAVHHKFWHSPAVRLAPLLLAAGTVKAIVERLAQVIRTKCKRCADFKLPAHRPQIKATLARFFNHYMQADLFFVLGGEYLLLIDELFRYKQAGNLVDRSFETLSTFMLQQWFRTFGPPCHLTVDQEGGLAGIAMACVCDKFKIQRHVAGSDPSSSGRQAKHTRTGLAEKPVDLLKLTMLKMHAEHTSQAIECSKEDLVAEACMAHNLLLTFNGVTPALGVTGITPREYFELDNETLDGTSEDANASAADRAAVSYTHLTLPTKRIV